MPGELRQSRPAISSAYPLQPLIREILEPYRPCLGSAFAAYFNHCQRVFHICRTLAGAEVSTREIAIAAAFHDLGIWSAGSFDYLAPSRRLADRYLAENGLADWSGCIQAMIDQHHKVTPYHGEYAAWVEPFRRADWADLSLGASPCQVPRTLLTELRAIYPHLGFHRLLARLTWRRFLSRPWSPLPMLRW